MRQRLTLKLHTLATDDLKIEAGSTTVAVSNILLRKEGDSRQINAAHVVVLAESIAALGLLEPIIVDKTGHLLAGGHRLAALQLLTITASEERAKSFKTDLGIADEVDPGKAAAALIDRIRALELERFSQLHPKAKVPVHVVDTEIKNIENIALAIEAAENSVRRQYSKEEITDLAKRLKKAGFTYKPGKPKDGEKSAIVALEAIVGKSTRQLKRILKSDAEKAKEKASAWDLAVAALRRASEKVANAIQDDPGPKRTAKGKRILEAVAAVDEALGDDRSE